MKATGRFLLLGLSLASATCGSSGDDEDRRAGSAVVAGQATLLRRAQLPNGEEGARLLLREPVVATHPSGAAMIAWADGGRDGNLCLPVDSLRPSLSADPSGRVVRLLVRFFDPEHGWDAREVELDRSDRHPFLYMYDASIDAHGNAFVAYSKGNKGYVRVLDGASGLWGKPVEFDPDDHVIEARVATDDEGHAILLYTRLREGKPSIRRFGVGQVLRPEELLESEVMPLPKVLAWKGRISFLGWRGRAALGAAIFGRGEFGVRNGRRRFPRPRSATTSTVSRYGPRIAEGISSWDFARSSPGTFRSSNVSTTT